VVGHFIKIDATMSVRSLPRRNIRLIFAVACFATACGAAAQTGVENFNLNGRYLAAARAGWLQDVQVLLAQGAAVDSRDRNGDAPLHYASRKGDAAMAAALIGAHADPNLPNVAGVTPLMAAAFGGHEAIVQSLLAAGAATDSVDRVAKTAAIYAAGNGHTGCLIQLLHAGVDVNRRYAHQTTLLMWAAGYGHEQTVHALLEAGAQAGLKDDRGKTALDVARDGDHRAVAQVLAELR
jgi:ankyrin repeat protein